MSNNVVTAEDVRLSYGETETLHGINLNMPQNQITALIGPSGSGKINLFALFEPDERFNSGSAGDRNDSGCGAGHLRCSN